MTIPSRVLGAGASSMMAVAICGDGVNSLTATGTTRSDALQLNKVYSSVNTAASGAGVLLPPTQMGAVIFVTNSGANTIKVYGYEAATTVNTAASASIAKDTSSIYFAVSNSEWYSINGTRT